MHRHLAKVNEAKIGVIQKLGTNGQRAAWVIAFALIATTLTQISSADSLLAVATAAAQEDCTSSDGTKVVESTGTKGGTTTVCQFSSGRFRPTSYYFDGQYIGWQELQYRLVSQSAVEAETCAFLKATAPDTTVDIHALGYANADSRNVPISEGGYLRYCVDASLTTGDDQNSGFSVKSGTVRVRQVSVLATSDSIPPPPPPPPPPSPTPPPPPPPVTGEQPWTIPTLDGESSPRAVRVTLPQGTLGPRTSTAVNPAGINGITKDGDTWRMNRDWNEMTDGGYLDFGAAKLDPNGRTVLGFTLEVPSTVGNGFAIRDSDNGEIGYFVVTNPNQIAANAYVKGNITAHHYQLLDVVGDAQKVATDETSVHYDGYVSMNVLPGGPSDKHYDGAQVHSGNPNSPGPGGWLTLERIVYEWNEAGTIANTTAAVFSQNNAGLVARDILTLNPGGTYQIYRLGGSGNHVIDRFQAIGNRRPNNNQTNKIVPNAIMKLTNGLSPSGITIFNDVPGADDFLIE